MYAGHVVACVGAALWAGSWWPLIVLLLSVLATHRLVIVPEEVYLGERYPDDCAAYRSRVRRWLETELSNLALVIGLQPRGR